MLLVHIPLPFTFLTCSSKEESNSVKKQWNTLGNILFDPLQLACETNLCHLIEPALDCIQVRFIFLAFISLTMVFLLFRNYWDMVISKALPLINQRLMAKSLALFHV